MKRSFLSLFLMGMISLGNITFATGQQSFPDLPSSHRNFDAIEYVKEEGIVKGYADGTFKPYNDIKRAEYTKVLVEAQFDDATIQSCLTEEQKQADHPFFSDINKGDWFIPYVCVAVKNGLIGGYPDGTFKPGNTIAFAESAKILINAFEPGKLQAADDVWFKNYIKELANQRHAVPGTILDFDQKMLRGEVAEMIYRVKEDITDKESPTFEDMNCPRGDVYIAANSTIEKNICVKEGNVTIEPNVELKGNIVVLKGNIKIDANADITGSIKMIEEGNLTIGANLRVGGDIQVERGNLSFGSNAEFGGKIEVLQGDINIESNVTAEKGIAAIRGAITIDGNAEVKNGDIEALNDIIIQANPTTKNVISSQGKIEIGGNADIQGDLIAMKDITVDSNLDATNVISFDGNVMLGANSSVKEIAAANNGTVSFDANPTANIVYAKKGLSLGSNADVQVLYGEAMNIGANATIGKTNAFAEYNVVSVQEKAMVNSEQKTQSEETQVSGVSTKKIDEQASEEGAETSEAESQVMEEVKTSDEVNYCDVFSANYDPLKCSE